MSNKLFFLSSHRGMELPFESNNKAEVQTDFTYHTRHIGEDDNIQVPGYNNMYEKYPYPSNMLQW